jgi:hypothetical protein
VRNRKAPFYTPLKMVAWRQAQFAFSSEDGMLLFGKKRVEFEKLAAGKSPRSTS